MPYGAIPRTTETEPETETETDTETENRNGNGNFNIRDFGLSTRIRSFVRVIFSVCLSVYFLDVWRLLYLPTGRRCQITDALKYLFDLTCSYSWRLFPPFAFQELLDVFVLFSSHAVFKDGVTLPRLCSFSFERDGLFVAPDRLGTPRLAR